MNETKQNGKTSKLSAKTFHGRADTHYQTNNNRDATMMSGSVVFLGIRMITRSKIDAVKRQLKTGKTRRQIAKAENLSVTTVMRISKGKLDNRPVQLLDFTLTVEHRCPTCGQRTNLTPCPICAANAASRCANGEEETAATDEGVNLVGQERERYDRIHKIIVAQVEKGLRPKWFDPHQPAPRRIIKGTTPKSPKATSNETVPK
ncbi:MAG: hypothetical protein LBQ66_00460 [Planctomycetaceae bacterium]|nr:hypothetical protein [Planctomycetaceae bacterium]